MSHSRDLLHLKHLREFGAYLESRGYIVVSVKGAHEVLRAVPLSKRKGEKPIIVYARADAKEHATVYGRGLELARAFYRSRASESGGE